MIEQSGYDIGCRTIQYIEKLRNGTADPLGEILDAGVLTEDNAADYIERNYQE